MMNEFIGLDSWTLSGLMSSSTAYETACAISSVPGIVMNGGYFNGYENTQYTSDGETFGNLPPMPLGLRYHCAVSLDGDDLFVTGGYPSTGKTFLYHSDTMQWEVLRDMPTPRSDLACGMVHNEAGEQEVITAGGYNGGDGGDYGGDVVEIYNLQSGKWREGKSTHFITNLTLKASILHRESFARENLRSYSCANGRKFLARRRLLLWDIGHHLQIPKRK